MVKKILIPNLKEILKTKWSHDIGYGFKGKKKSRINALEQGTTPRDSKVLEKLGIKKREKVLVIAAYYASWASELQKAKARIDYSDISKPIVDWVKKNEKIKFGKYICSNYELIPKNPKEYDWTFTYEACGGGRGLPLAYLRSLLNSNGGILVIHLGDEKHQKANISKLQKYPNIVKILSKIYNAKSSAVKKKIKARKRGEKNIEIHEFLVSKIKTNNSARKKVELDLEILNFIQNKKIINLEKDSKRLKIDKKGLKDSLIRISKIAKLIKAKGCLREVELK